MPQALQMSFNQDGALVHCDVVYKGPMGTMVARGTVNRAEVAKTVDRLIARHGKGKVASVMGCNNSMSGIVKEVDAVTKAVALKKVAQMLGCNSGDLLGFSFNPLTHLKSELNPLTHLRRVYRTATMPLSLTRRLLKRRKGKGGVTPESGPEGKDEDSSEDESEDESEDAATQQKSSGYEKSEADMDHPELGGIFDIGDNESGFVPAALAAYQHRRQLAKIAKTGSPRAKGAANLIAKKNAGDKGAARKILNINAKAKAGDPQAKRDVRTLKAVDKLATVTSPGSVSRVRALFRDGIR